MEKKDGKRLKEKDLRLTQHPASAEPKCQLFEGKRHRIPATEEIGKI